MALTAGTRLGPYEIANMLGTLFKTNALVANHRGSTIDIPSDVSADGQRFLLNERLTPAGQGAPITVVLNWTAALKK
jgi:hypothetical protein